MKLLKRPSDQAKLLFFGLLRTVSALATEPKISSTTATSTSVHTQIPSFHHHNPTAALPPLPCPQLSLRLARRSDVPSISRCNLATLPENYNSGFYVNHLRQWPELAIVAVDESATTTTTTTNSGFHFGKETPEPTVVAYVLGKVEERPVLMMDPTDDDNYDENAYGQYNTGIPQNRYVTERLGHVTSLAVLEDYRRRGLAMQLMKQLHYHLVSVYGVNAVGLHVRQSNEAAAKLYKNFGYIPAEIIPSYYQDGEDAYFMKKDLHALQEQYRAQRNNHIHHHQNGASGGGGGFFLGAALRRRPWEEGPSDLLLPRSVGGKPAQTQLQSSSSSSPSSSSRVVDDDVSPELLTGTM